MSSYETSLVTASERETDFKAVLDAILDPLFQMCELGAKDLTRFNQAIYMVNCLHYVQVKYMCIYYIHSLKYIYIFVKDKKKKKINKIFFLFLFYSFQ